MNLVTGGAGFIGSHLVAALLGQGEEVRVLEHPGARIDHLPLEGIDLVRADICDREAMAHATRGCTHVYHLAADPNLWRRDLREYDAINHRGALNVIHDAFDDGAEWVLSTTTESILASTNGVSDPVEQRELRER